MDSNYHNNFSHHWNWMAGIYSGVFNGAKKLGIPIPTMKNITEKARQYISNISNSNSRK